MKNIVVSMAAVCFNLMAMAQQDSSHIRKHCLQFHSINAIGLLEGQAGTAVQVQTVNGVKIKNWFTGVGVGIDHYSIRTIPLFLDVRTNLFSSKRSPFMYADGGVNYVWLKQGTVTYYNSKYNPGLYIEAGLGYTIDTKKSGSFIVSAGYSQKSYTEKQQNYIYYDYPVTPGLIETPVTPGTYTSSFSYTLRRISIKVGWSF